METGLVVELARHQPCPENSRLAAPQGRLEIADHKGVEQIEGQKHRQQKVFNGSRLMLVDITWRW